MTFFRDLLSNHKHSAIKKDKRRDQNTHLSRGLPSSGFVVEHIYKTYTCVQRNTLPIFSELFPVRFVKKKLEAIWNR